MAPSLANDTEGTVAAAREPARADRPAQPVGQGARPPRPGCRPSDQLISEGRSINVTLIFGLDRYDAVMEAYLSGLEAFAGAGATDLSGVHSVASFFVSRVDTEVDRRLEALAGGSDGDPALLALRGRAAVAQAQEAYQHFLSAFSGSPLGGAGGQGRPGAAAAVGVHLHQEPRLPRPPLRGHA